jgi:hypothetical protein
MPSNVIYVVGNNLASSAGADDIVSISQLVEQVVHGRLGGREVAVVLGQGIGKHDLDYLHHVVKVNDAVNITIHGEFVAELVGRAATHKSRTENVLIGDLRQTSEGVFSARLCVSDTNEMVLDHGSSDHLSGMVLMEAGRQMSLAVAETYFIPAGPQRQRFVIHSWRTDFRRFLVPLEAEMILKLGTRESGRSGSLRFSVRCEVVQAGRVSAVHEIDFSAFPVAVVQAIEEQQAADVLRTLLERVPAL